ncbi:hypothetical protein CJD36_017270 [Flavipsychrobacter stenotrophus]|uniref:VCBS repeat-containing protein n=1 Tax=Flavipsychrobacter stenotrophus TaxID=2077091 RepID=A0A2S7SRY8_9BACT|nr:hypothetical protein [Flavipsychrobacter stenotrophus]PQJ09682.1 hypothetical protein CJD36_017270 [Flavipsychrobacter stenotrophus]
MVHKVVYTHDMKSIFSTIVLAFLLPSLLFAQTKSSLRRQAKKIATDIEMSLSPAGGCDTLMDLNGDGFKDIVVEFYSGCGTGEKNGTIMVMYDTMKRRFDISHQVNIPNAHFDFKKHTVTKYYVANGGGYAMLYKWKGIKLMPLEKIEVDVDREPTLKFRMTKKNMITGKTVHWVSDAVSLPSVYHYYRYRHLIRRCSESDDVIGNPPIY